MTDDQNRKEIDESMSYQEVLDGIQRCTEAFIKPAINHIMKKLKEKEDDSRTE
jgi:hypothetical protein